MDDLQTGTPALTPGAETPAAGAPAETDLELELDSEAVGDDQAEGDDAELEDWEEEGKTYKVPKPLKPKLMLQRDYTVKTQEIAETRKQIEAQRAEVEETAKFHRENVREVAKLVNLDEQLEAFRAITAEQWDAMPVEQASKLQTRFNLLKDQRERAVGELQQKQHQALEKQRGEHAKLYQDSLARIAKDIPGWSDELAGKLNGYALSKGYTEQQLREMVLRPHDVGTLHKAYLYDQLVAKQRARSVASKEGAPAPQPVPKVGARRSPPSSEPLDSDPPDVWLRKRNKQLGIGA